MKLLVHSEHIQPVEVPSRGLLRDCEIFANHRYMTDGVLTFDPPLGVGLRVPGPGPEAGEADDGALGQRVHGLARGHAAHVQRDRVLGRLLPLQRNLDNSQLKDLYTARSAQREPPQTSA